MEVTCFVKKEGNQYTSLCVELDVASCYRPVPMNELKTFLFPEHQTEEKSLKAIPLSFQYA